ncbi:MAG: M50 family metallopeptidase [Cyanobacteria bacterium J06597_1]
MAFFLCIPLAVLVHEFGHALATWQVGGQVLEFQWRGFWGYVVPYGTFSQLEFWWIALAGNLASLLVAIAVLLVGVNIQRHIVGQILTAFGLLEFTFAMVLYPIMSFAIPDFTGDWVRIYQFSVAPYAQFVLTLHLIAIAIFYKIQRPIRLRAMTHVQLPPQLKNQSTPIDEP